MKFKFEQALKTTVLAVVVGAFSFTAFAADKPKPPTKKGADKKKEKKDFVWTFSSCRDPFKFRSAAAAPIDTPPVQTTNTPVVDTGPKQEEIVPTTAIEAEALKKAKEGWAALYAGNFGDAEKSYSDALLTLKKATSSSAKTKVLYQRRLDTAKRLNERKKVEQEFKARHLKITGIVWLQGTGASASATISGKSYVAGNRIENTDIVITHVGREYVICKLRNGIRVKLDLNQ